MFGRVRKFLISLTPKARRERKEINELYLRLQRELLIITTTFHALLDHLATKILVKGFSEEEIAKNKGEAVKLVDSLLDVTRGQRSEIEGLKNLQEEEITELEREEKMSSMRQEISAIIETLNAEEHEKKLYNDIVGLLNTKADLLAQLHDLVSRASPQNIGKIKDIRRQFEQRVNELSAKIKEIKDYEERLAA